MKHKNISNSTNFLKNSIIFTIILFLIDILTKYYFTNKSYFENFFIYIKYSENYGSAFSMFSDVNYYNYLIILLSFIVLFILFKYKNQFLENKYTMYAFYLIIPGILGNLYDRIIFGFVRDFLAIKYLFIFNIADVYLTFAVLLFIYSEFKSSNSNKLSKENKN